MRQPLQRAELVYCLEILVGGLETTADYTGGELQTHLLALASSRVWGSVCLFPCLSVAHCMHLFMRLLVRVSVCLCIRLC